MLIRNEVRMGHLLKHSSPQNFPYYEQINIYECPTCRTLLVVSQEFKEFNCRVFCKSCDMEFVGVDNSMRCKTCDDRVECLLKDSITHSKPTLEAVWDFRKKVSPD